MQMNYHPIWMRSCGGEGLGRHLELHSTENIAEEQLRTPSLVRHPCYSCVLHASSENRLATPIHCTILIHSVHTTQSRTVDDRKNALG